MQKDKQVAQKDSPSLLKIISDDPFICSVAIRQKYEKNHEKTTLKRLVVTNIMTKANYALKILDYSTKEAFEDDEAFFKKLIDIKHTNIARIMDFYPVELPENTFAIMLVMELEDCSLEDYLKSHIFSEIETIEIIWQLFKGLQCVHQKGIHHLNLHCKNILVFGNIYKLSDFWAERKFIAWKEVYHQMVPEIYRKDPKIMYDKVDFFFLGIVLFQIAFNLSSKKDQYLLFQRLTDMLSFPELVYNEGINKFFNDKNEKVGLRYAGLWRFCFNSLLSFNPEKRKDFANAFLPKIKEMNLWKFPAKKIKKEETKKNEDLDDPW